MQRDLLVRICGEIKAYLTRSLLSVIRFVLDIKNFLIFYSLVCNIYFNYNLNGVI